MIKNKFKDAEKWLKTCSNSKRKKIPQKNTQKKIPAALDKKWVSDILA